MDNKSLLLFFAGIGVGAFLTRWYLKDKYNNILESEIERVNEELKKYVDSASDNAEEAAEETEPEKPSGLDMKLFKHEVAKQGYDMYFQNNCAGKENIQLTNDEEEEDYGVKVSHPVESTNEPYVISANEFATDRAHDKITLTYYINAGVLCEEDKVVDNDFSELLGDDWKGHFHDEEDGVVYVRNEKLGADYEVLLDESSKEFVRDNLGFGGE